MGWPTMTHSINQNPTTVIVVFCKMNLRFKFYLLCFAILKNGFGYVFNFITFFGDSIHQYKTFDSVNSILKNL